MKGLYLRLAALTALAAVFLTGCVGVSFTTGPYYRRGAAGSGMLREDLDLEAFHGLRVDGAFTVTYTKAAECAVSLEVREDLASYVEIAVEDGVLIANSEDRYVTGPDSSPILHVSAPTLEILQIFGAVSLKSTDAVRSERFEILVAGAASLDIPLEVDSLDVVIEGASSVELEGRADSTRVIIEGASSVNALDLETKQATVTISGVGSCTLSCSEDLEVNIGGMGTMEYRGSPELRQNISGMGTVRKAR